MSEQNQDDIITTIIFIKTNIMSKEKQTVVEWFAEITAQLGYVSADVLKEAKQREKDRIRRIAYNAYCEAQIGTPSENNFNKIFLESIKDL